MKIIVYRNMHLDQHCSHILCYGFSRLFVCYAMEEIICSVVLRYPWNRLHNLWKNFQRKPPPRGSREKNDIWTNFWKTPLSAALSARILNPSLNGTNLSVLNCYFKIKRSIILQNICGALSHLRGDEHDCQNRSLKRLIILKRWCNCRATLILVWVPLLCASELVESALCWLRVAHTPSFKRNELRSVW